MKKTKKIITGLVFGITVLSLNSVAFAANKVTQVEALSIVDNQGVLVENSENKIETKEIVVAKKDEVVNDNTSKKIEANNQETIVQENFKKEKKQEDKKEEKIELDYNDKEATKNIFSKEEINKIQAESTSKDDEIDRAILFANSKINFKYSQAERDSGNAYDCSSLTYYSFLNAGINLMNNGSNVAASICHGLINKGREIKLENIKKGDLIFYAGKGNGRFLNINHVAIYIGNGQMIEASQSNGRVKYSELRTGNMVKICRPI